MEQRSGGREATINGSFKITQASYDSFAHCVIKILARLEGPGM
jgi:hypothetical protein